MSQRTGYLYRVDVNGIPFKTNRYEIEPFTNAPDTSHSESEFGQNGRALKRCNLTLEQPTFDEESNIFSAAFGDVDTGDTVPISIYPAGRTFQFNNNVVLFSCEECRLTRGRLSGEVDGNQPVNLSFLCHDAYSLPGFGF